MNKPITVARQEFIEEIIKCINDNPLPSFVVIDVLKTLIPVLETNVKKEYEADVSDYIKALQAEQEVLAKAENEKLSDKTKTKGGKHDK